MADRILVWSVERYPGRSELMPAYYLDEDYEPVAIRIYAEEAPRAADATFDILCDGASILADKGRNLTDLASGKITDNSGQTTVELCRGETSEVNLDEGDFSMDTLSEGSWITARCYADGAGRFFTLVLELEIVHDNDDIDED